MRANNGVNRFRILAVKAAKHPARATIDIVYQQISDGHYNGRGVKFFLHPRQASYFEAEHGLHLGTRDLSDGRGKTQLELDLSKLALVPGQRFYVTAYWPNGSHRWGVVDGGDTSRVTHTSGVVPESLTAPAQPRFQVTRAKVCYSKELAEFEFALAAFGDASALRELPIRFFAHRSVPTIENAAKGVLLGKTIFGEGGTVRLKLSGEDARRIALVGSTLYICGLFDCHSDKDAQLRMVLDSATW